jgi:hypothetical protein
MDDVFWPGGPNGIDETDMEEEIRNGKIGRAVLPDKHHPRLSMQVIEEGKIEDGGTALEGGGVGGLRLL